MNWRFWTTETASGPDACADIELLLSLDADGMAALQERQRIESHLATCASCRKAQAWIAATQKVMVARPTAAPPADMRARIAQALAAAPAAPTAPVVAPPVRRRPLLLRPAVGLAFSVALAGAIVGRSYLIGHSPHPAGTKPPITVAVLPPIQSVAPITVAPPAPVIHKHPAPAAVPTRMKPAKIEDKVAFAPTPTEPAPHIERHKLAPKAAPAPKQPTLHPAIHPQTAPDKMAKGPVKPHGNVKVATIHLPSVSDTLKLPAHQPEPEKTHLPVPPPEIRVATLPTPPAPEPDKPATPHVQVVDSFEDPLASVRQHAIRLRQASSEHFGQAVSGAIRTAALEPDHTTTIASIVHSDINRNR